MIHYDLRCTEADHRFDGWFRDSATFERQAEAGHIECPVCADRRIVRALMAPAVSTRRAALPAPEQQPPAATPASAPVAAQPAPPPAPMAGGRLPDAMRALLQRLRAEVERNCDYVGPGFAQEARKMHRGEIDHRAIYGEATPDDAEALANDGIEVNRIPWVPLSDA
jgi:hypothetical protein